MRLMRFMLLIVVVLVTMGCGSAKDNKQVILDTGNQRNQASQVDGTGTKKIALVMKTLTNPFFVEMEKGARKAATELGVNLIVKTGAQETSITQQIAIIEELITNKVDAIVIAPASSIELIPVLKKAQDAKIKIINIDNQLDTELSHKIGLIAVPFISVNNEQGAYLSAQYMSEQMTTPTDVVILEGIKSTQNSQDRSHGALRAFQENANIHVVAVETANWKIDEAYEITKNLYERFPNIGAFFCANDMMALGTAQYLAEHNQGKVLVAAYDALAEAKEAIKAGKMTVTIDQQADVQGYLGVTYALQAIKGDKVPLETLVDVRIVHRGNLK